MAGQQALCPHTRPLTQINMLGRAPFQNTTNCCCASGARSQLDFSTCPIQNVEMNHRKKPLYRSVNTRTRNVRHGSGSKSKWERNTKASAQNQSAQQSMHSGQRHGFDYTPLFKFLLSRVGKDWNDVHSEAVSRLDHEDPIHWMVAPNLSKGRRFFRAGESSYFSGLYVDDSNILALVDPEITPDTMQPYCSCCTHTLNGVLLSTPYPGASI